MPRYKKTPVSQDSLKTKPQPKSKASPKASKVKPRKSVKQTGNSKAQVLFADMDSIFDEMSKKKSVSQAPEI
jgi:hypothetical protein